MKINLCFNKDLEVVFKLLNYNARLVGGCVRDFILYNKLVEDVDIATPLLPNTILELLSSSFNVIPTGLKHGTVTVVSDRKYEITTLRKDIETYGRSATVQFNVSYEEDAKRRDFTINALYYDYEGNLYDYFNGLEDLKNRYVRFIGNAEDRINEDYLRILRFFRFFMRFGSFCNEDLMKCYDLKHNLVSLSKERITSEWFNIIKGEYFLKYFDKIVPILEVLGFSNVNDVDLEKMRKLSPLGLTSLFYNQDILLRLSNAEKKYINDLFNLPLNNQTDANIIFNKYGETFLSDKQILGETNFTAKNIDLMPIKGADLLKYGYHGAQIGEILKKLEYIWYDKYPISKEDLLKNI